MSLLGFADPARQAWMVLDRSRTLAYARAIESVVHPGDVVLDIGTGSGVLALLAAKRGAARVYGFERSRAHELARAHVRAAGLDSVVEIVHADLMDVDTLPARPNIILGEVLGHFAPDENMHALYRHAARLSADDARTIPGSYRVTLGLAALAGLRDDLEFLERGLPIPLGVMAQRIMRRPTVVSVPEGALLTSEAETAEHSLLDPEPESFAVEANVERPGEANVIVAAFRSTLARDIEIDTRASAPRTCWEQLVFPIHPIRLEPGDTVQLSVEPRSLARHDTYRWSVCTPRERRDHDGLDAHGELDANELARAMGFAPAKFSVKWHRELRAWRAALQVEDGAPFATMVASVRRALSEEALSEREARRLVLDLLHSARALEE